MTKYIEDLNYIHVQNVTSIQIYCQVHTRQFSNWNI